MERRVVKSEYDRLGDIAFIFARRRHTVEHRDVPSRAVQVEQSNNFITGPNKAVVTK
jgi:hypothetical protein